MSDPADQNQPAGQAGMPRRPPLIDPERLGQIRNALAAVSRPWWTGEEVSENGLIYGANIHGARPPLIWCFQGHGEFAAFARALGPDQPLYGMRSGHMVLQPSHENHLHMALVCAAELQSLGLDGPLVLGGNCQGALLAQKMAEILTAAGQAVSLLIELNPFVLTPYGGRTALIVGRYDTTNPFERFHNAEALLRANLPNGTVDTLPSKHGELFRGRILELLCQAVRRRMDEAAASYPGSFPDWSLSADLSLPPQLELAAGSLHDLPVTLRNTSGSVWRPSAESGISLGNHWLHGDGRLAQWRDGLQGFDSPLPPGAQRALTLLVRAPFTPGEYVLQADLQLAGIAWLSELGRDVPRCQVRVLPPA